MAGSRDPETGAPVRMEPIATLPVFFKLAGKRTVIAGGGEPAVWKAELLAAAGAIVEIFAAEPCPALVALAAEAATVTITRRNWCPDDLRDAAMALGAIEEEREAGLFQAAAHAAGVPVNVIDKPVFCDFQFGTIVSRSPLVIGISTDGAAPVFGQAIRARIETLLPQALRSWAAAARDWRPAVQARNLDFRGRRRFWEVFATRALASPTQAPTSADYDACLAGLAAPDSQGARLTLVGSGTGRPDSVTLEAIGALQDADIVFFGEAISPLVIGFARREASKIRLPDSLTAADCASRISAEAAPARRLVWVDAGSPAECLVWISRTKALAAAGLTGLATDGLGRCGRCKRGCPRWKDPDASVEA